MYRGFLFGGFMKEYFEIEIQIKHTQSFGLSADTTEIPKNAFQSREEVVEVVEKINKMIE